MFLLLALADEIKECVCTWVSSAIGRILYIFKRQEHPYLKSFIALNVIFVNSRTTERRTTVNISSPSESGFNFQGYCWENK